LFYLLLFQTIQTKTDDGEWSTPGKKMA